MSTNIFEIATKKKYRFDSTRGQLTIEDLWDLPLDGKMSLNAVAKGLSRSIKELEEESFVSPSTTGSTALNQKMDIVKRVIEVRITERDAAKAAKENAVKKQKIMEILEKKEDDSLSNMTPEQLKEMLASL